METEWHLTFNGDMLMFYPAAPGGVPGGSAGICAATGNDVMITVGHFR
jgi:hypothetical protein